MVTHKILIVDDEKDTLDLYQKFLGNEPYTLVTVSSPKKAVEMLERETWDLLISDIVMPGIDGFELIKRAMQANTKINTIAVTGYGSDKVLKKVLEFDCFGYINKPFDWEYLKLLIKKALEQGGKEKAASLV